MGFLSDRIAAERAGEAYVKRLQFPGVEPDTARKTAKAIRWAVYSGFLDGLKDARDHGPQADAHKACAVGFGSRFVAGLRGDWDKVTAEQATQMKERFAGFFLVGFLQGAAKADHEAKP